MPAAACLLCGKAIRRGAGGSSQSSGGRLSVPMAQQPAWLLNRRRQRQQRPHPQYPKHRLRLCLRPACTPLTKQQHSSPVCQHSTSTWRQWIQQRRQWQLAWRAPARQCRPRGLPRPRPCWRTSSSVQSRCKLWPTVGAAWQVTSEGCAQVGSSPGLHTGTFVAMCPHVVQLKSTARPIPRPVSKRLIWHYGCAPGRLTLKQRRFLVNSDFL